jgi:hypothetical protein
LLNAYIQLANKMGFQQNKQRILKILAIGSSETLVPWDYWVFGLCPSSGVLNLLGRADLSHWTSRNRVGISLPLT